MNPQVVGQHIGVGYDNQLQGLDRVRQQHRPGRQRRTLWQTCGECGTEVAADAGREGIALTAWMKAIKQGGWVLQCLEAGQRHELGLIAREQQRFKGDLRTLMCREMARGGQVDV